MNFIKRDYSSVSNDMSKLLFDSLLKRESDSSFIDTGTWAPAVDIREENDCFMVLADIPGVNQKDIHVSLEDNLLTIHGERQFENASNDGYSRMERIQGQFYRRFSLPQNVDESKINAKYKHGVLKVSIPKKEAVMEKRIEVHLDEED